MSIIRIKNVTYIYIDDYPASNLHMPCMSHTSLKLNLRVAASDNDNVYFSICRFSFYMRRWNPTVLVERPFPVHSMP